MVGFTMQCRHGDNLMELRCRDCHKTPSQIDEYLIAAEDFKMSPEEYVRREEGTLNRETGQFFCTACYVTRGMPLGTA